MYLSKQLLVRSNRLSVVFDEVIVKERILVEGGKSKAILTQFDGPVTFTNTARFNQLLTLNGVPYSLRTKGTVTIQSINEAIKCTGDLQAALRVYGGVSIQKNMYICDDIVISNGGIQVAGIGTFNNETQFNGKLNVNADIDISGNNKLLIGPANDLEIYHNGSNSIIGDVGTGNLSLQTNGSQINMWNTSDTELCLET